MAVPSTTVAQLQTLMLSWLDDASAGYFDSATTITWINLAQREVQKQLVMAGENYYVQTATTTLVPSQAEYVLPADFLKEHRVEIIISGTGSNENRQALVPITINEQDQVSIALGQSTNYYIQKNSIILSPTPDTALTMRLYYSYKISDIALTTDVCDIPEEFQEYVACLAAYNGFIKDDREAANLLTKIADYKERLKQMAEDRVQDISRQVVIVDDTLANGWF